MLLTATPLPAVNADASARESVTTQPNIIMILLDDTGAREFSCYGNTFNETPYIDGVASEGMRFNHFYTQPVCSPSRGCLMTGNNTLRNGVTNFLQENHPACLDPNEFTVLPELMGSAGYHTGIIGKWHLCAGTDWDTSAGAVKNFGWDETIMCEQKSIGYGDYYYPYTHIPQATGESGEYLVDAMYDQALDYINRNKEEPFFLYLSHYATHITLDAPEESVQYFQEKRGAPANRETNDRNPYLAAMLKHLDDGVGEIDKLLEELGLKENTILIIASDNGGETRVTSNGELRGGKRQLYEGGITSPLIIRWPEKMSHSEVVETPVSMIDFYSTFGEAAGLSAEEIPENSGVSLLPLLTQTGELDRDTLYWVYPRNTDYKPGDNLSKAEFHAGGAIRKNDFKYLESFAFPNRRELYDLSADPGESTNIIAEYPQLYRQLSRELHENLEKDTIGKVFNATFADKENYRYHSIGGFSRSGGKYKSSGDALSIVTVEDYWYYDTQSEVEVAIGEGGRAGLILRSNLAAPSNNAYTSYAVAVNSASNSVDLLNIRAKEVFPIASASAEIKANTTYKLKVITDSYNIKVYLNEALVLECNDESYFKGSLGLYSEGASATFDNLTVTGIKGTNPVTDRQLGLETEYDTNIVYNDLYVTFDEAPCEIDGVLYVEAEKILNAIGGKFSTGGDNVTLSYFGREAVFTVNSLIGKLNGGDFKWNNSPVIKNEKVMISLADICNALALGQTKKDNTINLTVQKNQEFTFENADLGGAWTKSGIRYTSTEKDASAGISFVGTEITVQADKTQQSGMFEVYLDGNLAAIIDGAGNVNGSIVYTSDGLANSYHTLKIVNRGEIGGGSGSKLTLTKYAVAVRDTDMPESEASNSEIIFDTDKRIIYKGQWENRTSSAAYGGTVTRSTTKDASAELSFNGHGIKLYLGRGTACGILEVYIDGVLADTIDGYSLIGMQKSLVYENLSLSEGKHTIQVINTGTKSDVSGGYNLNIDAFEVLSSEAVAVSDKLILNSDSKIAYTGSWHDVVFENAYGGTVTRSTAKSTSAQLTFDGHGIRLYIGKGPVCGMFEVYLDGKLVETVDGYQKDSAQKIIAYENLNLDAGIHTIKVVNLGTKNASSTGTNLNLDAFRTFNVNTNISDSQVATVISAIKYLPNPEDIVENHRNSVEYVATLYNSLSNVQKESVINFERLKGILAKLNAPSILLGDVNLDGKINSTDFMQVRRHYLGLYSITGDGLIAADVNSDGKINSTDFMQIRRHYLGLYNIG